MHDGRVGRHPRPGALAPCAAAEVGLLAVHHEGRVEAAQGLPVVAADQEEAAHHHVDLALAVALPVAVELGVEEGAPAERQRQAGGAAEQAPERDVAEDAGRVQAAVAAERAAAPDARLRRALGEADDAVDRVLEHQGVGVEQQQVLAPRLARRDVVAAGEAEILRARDQPDPGIGRGDRRGRAVGGGVVEHDQLVRHRRLGDDAGDAVERHRPGVVADHQNRDDRRDGGRLCGQGAPPAGYSGMKRGRRSTLAARKRRSRASAPATPSVADRRDHPHQAAVGPAEPQAVGDGGELGGEVAGQPPAAPLEPVVDQLALEPLLDHRAVQREAGRGGCRAGRPPPAGCGPPPSRRRAGRPRASGWRSRRSG